MGEEGTPYSKGFLDSGVVRVAQVREKKKRERERERQREISNTRDETRQSGTKPALCNCHSRVPF